jgi:hypothetical protein
MSNALRRSPVDGLSTSNALFARRRSCVEHQQRSVTQPLAWTARFNRPPPQTPTPGSVRIASWARADDTSTAPASAAPSRAIWGSWRANLQVSGLPRRNAKREGGFVGLAAP